MKKMLFIGAMLIVGMTAFGGKGVTIGNTVNGNVHSGDADLGIMAVGEVVDKTSNVILSVKPTLSAGDDGGSLHFRFGEMKAGSAKDVTGEFTIEVLKDGLPVSMTVDGEADGNSALTVELAGGTNVVDNLPSGTTAMTSELKQVQTATGTAPAKVGELRYTLSGKTSNSAKLYTGTVISNVILENTAEGSFQNDACRLDIKIAGLQVK